MHGIPLEPNLCAKLANSQSGSELRLSVAKIASVRGLRTIAIMSPRLLSGMYGFERIHSFVKTILQLLQSSQIRGCSLVLSRQSMRRARVMTWQDKREADVWMSRRLVNSAGNRC